MLTWTKASSRRRSCCITARSISLTPILIYPSSNRPASQLLAGRFDSVQPFATRRSDGGPGIWGSDEVTNSGDMWHVTVSLPEQ
ncbi:hypothetical protein FXO21_26695 [Dyadobacter sp. UC 10]|nr:hypothetical protein FXO21_26695 [Dyadobacter sp. UC 10]